MYLTIPQAHKFIVEELGFSNVSVNQVRKAADNMRLPFFIPPFGKARVIDSEELRGRVFRASADAINTCDAKSAKPFKFSGTGKGQEA